MSSRRASPELVRVFCNSTMQTHLVAPVTLKTTFRKENVCLVNATGNVFYQQKAKKETGLQVCKFSRSGSKKLMCL